MADNKSELKLIIAVHKKCVEFYGYNAKCTRKVKRDVDRIRAFISQGVVE